MLHDQATQLRELVRRHQLRQQRAGRATRLVLVTGGSPKVGTTSLAVNLALALAAQRLRTVLVDAELEGAGATALGGVAAPPRTIVDVLAGHCPLAEALLDGAGGIRLLAGLWGGHTLVDALGPGQRTFVDELLALADCDVVVVDGGCRRSDLTGQLWQAADAVVLVSASEQTAMIGTYALLKALSRRDDDARAHIIVNAAADEHTARHVAERLIDSARRFLELDVASLGWLPRDAELTSAHRNRQPVLLQAPACQASRAIVAFAHAVLPAIRLPAQIGESTATAA
jgi:flagellar biosynthesis protein FlhG